eukprot:764138-Hanusia_phi.AAC.5
MTFIVVFLTTNVVIITKHAHCGVQELVYLLVSRAEEARGCGENFFLDAASVLQLVEQYQDAARLLLLSSRACYPAPRSLVALSQILMRSNSHALAVQVLLSAAKMLGLDKSATTRRVKDAAAEDVLKKDPSLAVERSSFWVYHHFPVIAFDSNLTDSSMHQSW